MSNTCRTVSTNNVRLFLHKIVSCQRVAHIREYPTNILYMDALKNDVVIGRTCHT